MKKILFIVPLLVALVCTGQQIQYLGGPTTQIYIRGELRVDTVVYFPLRDTNFTPSRIGGLVVKGTQPYIWTGTKWTAMWTGSPIWGQIEGTLSDQTDLQTALNAKQNTISAGYGIKIATNTILFDSANVRKVDTVYRLTDSTLAFKINGISYSVLLRGTAAGGINSLVLSVPSALFTTPVTFSNTGGAWTGTLSTPNQSANAFFAGPSIGSPAQPAFRQLATADLPTGIPNGNLATPYLNFGIGTSGSDVNWNATPVNLGGTATLNVPDASASNRGALKAVDWSFFHGKLDSVHISNDSVYNCANGTCTLQSVLVDALARALGSAHLFVGNGSNIATDVALSGDASIVNTGALTVTGLKGKALPSLTPGVLQYNGTNWLLNSAGVTAAYNGLTDSSGTVKLGGALNQNTEIDDSTTDPYYIHFKTTPAPGASYNLGPFPRFFFGETVTVPTAANTNYINDTHDNLNSPIVVSRNVAIPDFNNVPFLTLTSGDGLQINGWLFKNFTSVAGKYEPRLMTFNNQDSAIQQHGYYHIAYMKHGRMTGSVSSAYVFAYENVDSFSLSNKTGSMVNHVASFVLETGSFHPFTVDSAWHARIGDTGSIGNITADGQLELVNDQTPWGVINKNNLGKNVFRGKVTIGGFFPATDTSHQLTVIGDAKINTNLYSNHLLGLGSAPASSALGTNVTSLTITGSDAYMKLVLVTSGAVSGSLGTITYATAWANTPIGVISYGDAITGAAVAGSGGGYIAYGATSTTQATLSGVITGAGTYTFYVHTGGN